MNSEPQVETIPDEESFALAHAAFLKALKLAAKDAEAQCETLGNFNVAWEMKNDLAAGEYLLSHAGGELAAESRMCLQHLLNLLQAIPDSVLAGTFTSADNLAAMKHESWTAIRVAASALITSIERDI